MVGSPSAVAVSSRTRSVSESESSFNLASSFSAPTFLKNIYQGSLGSLSSLADSGTLKRWEGVFRGPPPNLDPYTSARDRGNGWECWPDRSSSNILIRLEVERVHFYIHVNLKPLHDLTVFLWYYVTVVLTSAATFPHQCCLWCLRDSHHPD